MDLYLNDSELCIIRSLLTERIMNIGVTITDCGLVAQKDEEYLYSHFKHERIILTNLYNKLCRHE